MTDQPHDQHDESHGGTGLYVSVFIALCVLTSLSFLTYFPFWRHHIPVGASRVFMIGVSCTKAMLVILFFMHLKWETNWKWMLTVPASLMSIFLVCVLIPDIGFRMRYASQERLIHASERPADVETSHQPSDQKNHHDQPSAPGHDAAHPSV